MGALEIILLVASIIGTAVTIGTSVYQSQQNEKSVQETNAANLEAVEKTNAANAEQAELAYRRSLPVNQIRTLMDAGMSRAGAMSKLTGGGTYTAPVLQSGSSMASQMDLSGVMSAMDNLKGIPSNVEQSRLQEQQLSDLRQLADLRQREALRKQEEHEFNMWEKLHGKKATEMIDSLASYLVSEADSRGVNIDEIDSIDKLVRTFDLGKNKDWRNMPHSARNQILEAVRTQHAINLQDKADERAEQASQDTHDIAEFEKSMKAIGLKYEEQMQLKKLELLSQQIASLGDDVTAKNMANAVRAAGFEDEKDANKALQTANKLKNEWEQEDRKNRSNQPKFARKFAQGVSYVVDVINPFKNFLNIK